MRESVLYVHQDRAKYPHYMIIVDKMITLANTHKVQFRGERLMMYDQVLDNCSAPQSTRKAIINGCEVFATDVQCTIVSDWVMQSVNVQYRERPDSKHVRSTIGTTCYNCTGNYLCCSNVTTNDTTKLYDIGRNDDIDGKYSQSYKMCRLSMYVYVCHVHVCQNNRV